MAECVPAASPAQLHEHLAATKGSGTWSRWPISATRWTRAGPVPDVPAV